MTNSDSEPGQTIGERRLNAAHHSSEVTDRGSEAAHGSSEAVDPWPLWEVFVRHRQGLEHKHCGSLHAADAQQALSMARDVYTRRQEGVSIWVVASSAITASHSEHREPFFDPMADKIYRHPSFYRLPEAVDHM